MTRVGKIARIPDGIREQLNYRLVNGEGGPTLLPWLNSLPEVQLVLAHYFGGQAINHQNLSAWRTGGYRDWKLQREMILIALERQSPKPTEPTENRLDSSLCKPFFNPCLE
jgi:hypothetical protein